MSELAAVAGLLACTSAVIGAGLAVGTHYIDKAFRIDDHEAAEKSPLVVPSRPSGSNWHVTDAA